MPQVYQNFKSRVLENKACNFLVVAQVKSSLLEVLVSSLVQLSLQSTLRSVTSKVMNLFINQVSNL